MDLVEINARDLPDAWFQCVFKVLDEGKVFTIDRGSYAGQRRLEFDYITVRVRYPNCRPLLPQIEAHFSIPNPVEDDYLDDYLPYLMTGELKPGESYTYGQRLCAAPLPFDPEKRHNKEWKDILIQDAFDEGIIFKNDKDEWCLDQIKLLIWTYREKGPRNNQMVLQVAQPTDMFLQDPPCLRQIDTRIQNGMLHFFPYFRSWDLYGGFPANLGGIQLLKEYVADEIGVKDGEIIASSKGLHIYDYTFDLAKMLRMKEDMELIDGDSECLTS